MNSSRPFSSVKLMNINPKDCNALEKPQRFNNRLTLTPQDGFIDKRLSLLKTLSSQNRNCGEEPSTEARLKLHMKLKEAPNTLYEDSCRAIKPASIDKVADSQQNPLASSVVPDVKLSHFELSVDDIIPAKQN